MTVTESNSLRTASYLLRSTGEEREREILRRYVAEMPPRADVTLVLFLAAPVDPEFIGFMSQLIESSGPDLPDVLVLVEGQPEADWDLLVSQVRLTIDADGEVGRTLAEEQGSWRRLVAPGPRSWAIRPEVVVTVPDDHRTEAGLPHPTAAPAPVTNVTPPSDAALSLVDGPSIGQPVYPRSPAVSYAQNHEDTLLRRVFGDVTQGVYVDVGAGHPVTDSVTKAFSDRGWNGVNVEANIRLCQLLTVERPRDVNIAAAASNRSGVAAFDQGTEACWGLSTLDRTTAQSAAANGHVMERRVVTVAPLIEMLRGAGITRYEFLKVDVEGHEREVLEGAGLNEIRPRVVVVESVLPNSSVRVDHTWNDILFEQGYVMAFFDGINCYFVQSTDDEARAQLSVPANVLDLARRPD